MGKSGQLQAKINPETKEVLCPTCEESNFKVFRRDKPPHQKFWCGGISKGVYLNHCKCENCAQLFVYKVDKINNIILEK